MQSRRRDPPIHPGVDHFRYNPAMRKACVLAMIAVAAMAQDPEKFYSAIRENNLTQLKALTGSEGERGRRGRSWHHSLDVRRRDRFVGRDAPADRSRSRCQRTECIRLHGVDVVGFGSSQGSPAAGSWRASEHRRPERTDSADHRGIHESVGGGGAAPARQRREGGRHGQAACHAYECGDVWKRHRDCSAAARSRRRYRHCRTPSSD